MSIVRFVNLVPMATQQLVLDATNVSVMVMETSVVEFVT